MGNGATGKGATAFIVCAKRDSKYAVRMLRDEGLMVLSGRSVSREARRMLVKGSPRIVIGHGEPGELWLASGRRLVAEQWLWVGMPQPPREARLYLYSCWCGCRLAPSLQRNFAVGHFGEVPIPGHGTEAVVLPFLQRVFQLMDRSAHSSPARLRRPLKQLATQLFAGYYFDVSGSLERLAATMLVASLYRKSCDKWAGA